ncbi:MAG: hypothetical protein KGJ41_00135 [Rhodospirillales bacterium]|nr:hypothetical protein [Rhodospirillales bacterium]MDE2197398.1 hypothetical protein [Rhodospirillales bacterium]MDE2575545.1 hypothetical protein [Rhodospirillales bacterium]
MDIYHVFCDTAPGTGDIAFAEALDRYLGHLRAEGLIERWRLTRAKLGFGLRGMGDWHIMLEVRDLVQLEAAFSRIATRADPEESLHHGVNSLVRNPVFALYRDFPDPVRRRGDEKF